MLESKVKLYTDGASRGNPGESACAFVICNMDDNVVEKSGFYLGLSTNNQAEYCGLERGLERVKALGIEEVEVYMDSELIVKQMNGLYRIKHPQLKPLYHRVMELRQNFSKISFTHVPRKLNELADEEVNRILDEHVTVG